MFAMKTIIPRGENSVDGIVNEIGLMKMLIDHKNILDCYETFKDQHRYYIIVEIMNFPLNDIISLF